MAAGEKRLVNSRTTTIGSYDKIGIFFIPYMTVSGSRR
jgi:hypothetical protein